MDVDRLLARGEAVCLQLGNDLLVHFGSVGRLRLGVDTDVGAVRRVVVVEQRQHFTEGGDTERVLRRGGEARVFSPGGEAGKGGQALDLVKIEILDKVAPVARRETLGHIGQSRATGAVVQQRGVMERDQVSVTRQLEIGLDDVRAHLHGEFVGRQRVLGEIAAGATMGDNQRRVAGQRREGCGACNGGGHKGARQESGDQDAA